MENSPCSLVMAPVTNVLSVGVSRITFTKGRTALYWASFTVPDSVTLVWHHAVTADVVTAEKTDRREKTNNFIGYVS